MPELRTPSQVLDHEFLEARCALVELAGMLDRYDRSVEATGGNGQPNEKIGLLREAAAILASADTSPNRAERLLLLFTDPADVA